MEQAALYAYLSKKPQLTRVFSHSALFKRARAFTTPLSDYLIGLLSARKADNATRFPDSPYVFPANSKSGHIEEPRPHALYALRHTFAAVCKHCVAIPHLHTKLLLNHAPPKSDVTLMYAGAGDTEALRASMQKITNFPRACLEPKSAGEVIPLPQRANRTAPDEDGASKVVQIWIDKHIQRGLGVPPRKYSRRSAREVIVSALRGDAYSA